MRRTTTSTTTLLLYGPDPDYDLTLLAVPSQLITLDVRLVAMSLQHGTQDEIRDEVLRDYVRTLESWKRTPAFRCHLNRYRAKPDSPPVAETFQAPCVPLCGGEAKNQ